MDQGHKEEAMSDRPKPSALSIANTVGIGIISVLLALLAMDHFEQRRYNSLTGQIANRNTERLNAMQFGGQQSAADEPRRR